MRARQLPAPAASPAAQARIAIPRRSALLALAAASAGGCSFDRFFHFGWEEEVQTAVGRVLVSLKYTYENLGGFFDRYERAILRSTEIAFDAGERIGRFSQSFDHHRVDMIQAVGDHWYLVLETRGGPPSHRLDNGTYEQIWGPVENALGQKCWRLDDRGFRRASLLDVPEPLLKPNLLMDYVPVRQLAALDGTRVSLAAKAALESQFPVAPPAGRIERPLRSQQ